MEKGDTMIESLLYRFEEGKANPVEEIGLHYWANGPTWSLDGEKFYYTCSETQTVRVYDYEKETGSIKNGRDLWKNDFAGSLPDGSTMDSQGRLWWALYNVIGNATKVVCIDPETGQMIRSIELEFTKATSVAFGGEDYTTLLVTSGTNLDTEQTMNNGGVAIIKFNDGTKGVPCAFYSG